MSLARALALACALLVPFAQSRIDLRLGSHRAAEEALYLWSGEDVRRLFPGLEGLMADVYWLRTVQYFGGQRVYSKDKTFEVLEPLIDITVTLDPRFEVAYRYGATFLSEPWPIGAGRPEAGVALLERGSRKNPRSWILMQNLGFFIYFHLKQAERASQVMLEASKLPGAPSWFATLAADFLVRGGERQTARKLWQHLHDQAEEGQLRRNAKAHLDYLEALDIADGLTRRVIEFREREGHNPRALEELTAAGAPSPVAVDPAGVPFDYDPETGDVSVSTKSRLWRSSLNPRPNK